jgi:hypothetical protein
VEREFFATGLEGTGALAVRGRQEQAFVASVTRRGSPAMGSAAEAASIEGVSSREQIRARRGALSAYQQAGEQALPRFAIATSTTSGEAGITEMLNPTRNQPYNARINEAGGYGPATAAPGSGDIMGVINMLRLNGMSDPQISRLMQIISREGRTPTVAMLLAHGFKGNPYERVPTGRTKLPPGPALRAVTQLTNVLEPLRFLDRGFGLMPQPVATTTALAHTLVQVGAVPLQDVLAAGAPLGPATHLRLGETRQQRKETIAASQVRITMLVEQVRKRWQDWVLQTQYDIVAGLEARGVATPNLVPTRAYMKTLLADFYGAIGHNL